jgi:hypothetical protein
MLVNQNTILLLLTLLAMLVTKPKRSLAKDVSAKQLHNKSFNPLRIWKLPSEAPVCIMDQGCDMAFAGQGCVILVRHNESILDVNDNKKRTLVDVVMTLIDPFDKKRIMRIRVNRAAWRPESNETLVPPSQIRWAGFTCEEKALSHGGKQNIMIKGTEIPLLFNGEQTFFLFKKTKECDTKLPKVAITSKVPNKAWTMALERNSAAYNKSKSPTISTRRTPTNVDINDDVKAVCMREDSNTDVLLSMVTRRRQRLWDAADHKWKPDQLTEWKKRLCLANDEQVKKTFLSTTQLVPSVAYENEAFPKQQHTARFPFLAARRLKEIVYCDPVCLNKNDGKKLKQWGMLFYTKNSRLKAYYKINERENAARNLETMYQFILDYGLPTAFKSDWASTIANSKEVQRFLKIHNCDIEASEGHLHNKPVEKAWQDLQKRGESYRVAWLVPDDRLHHMYQHLSDCHNHTALASLKWRTPIETADGDTPDISVFRFHFWESVWYLHKTSLMKDRKWMRGRFVGVAWHTGDSLCYKVQCDETGEQRVVVHRSLVLPRHIDETAPKQLLHYKSDYFFPTPVVTKPNLQAAAQPEGRKRKVEDPVNDSNNKRVRFSATETEPDQTAKSSDKYKKGNKSEKKRKSIKPGERTTQGEPTDLGETPEITTPHPDWDINLLDPVEQRLRADYLKQVAEQQNAMDLLLDPEPILDAGFIIRITRHNTCTSKDGTQRLEFQCEGTEGKPFKCVASDLQVDAPMTFAKYLLDPKRSEKLKKNGHHELVRWAVTTSRKGTKLLQIAKRMEGKTGIKRDLGATPSASVRRLRLVKCRRTKKAGRNDRKTNPEGNYQYGVKVPRNTREAMQFDANAGNNLWKDAIFKEIEALMSMGTFKIVAERERSSTTKNCQFAPLRVIFACKQDGRRKARCVIGGHVVDAGGYDTYAGNMKGISARLLMCIAAANDLEVLTGDIGK